MNRLFPVGLAVVAVSLVGPSCGARTDVGGLDPGEIEPRSARCGDGVVDGAGASGKDGSGADGAGEECDDANESNDDACLTSCVRARCGDGFVRTGFEACDGATDSSSSTTQCTSDCGLGSCGDGIVQDGEECDGGPGCTPSCFLPACGDGIVQDGEACDEGAANDDRRAAYFVYADTVYDATPVQTGQDVYAFYDYRSASGHTGYEDVGRSTLLLFFDPLSAGLGLVTLHGIDRGDGGPSQGKGHVTQTFTSLPDGASILVSDDRPEEFDFIGPHEVLGDFGFDDNTDGGVIGLPWPGHYVIEIDTTFDKGITTWALVSANGQVLDGGENLHATLVVQTTPGTCRTDCTVPRCNDGILDAGEVCDDGNPDAGDGCAPDCQGP